MASVLIRDVDDSLHRRLKQRAALHRRSLEEEARELLRLGVASPAEPGRENLADIASRLFGAAHGAELDLPPRGSAPGRVPAALSSGLAEGGG
jgi:plasmid stability protein